MDLSITNYKGEFAALSAAVLWASSAVVYSRVGQQISPIALNILKGAVAIALLMLTLFIRGEWFPTVSPVASLLLMLSGILGIGLGDTFYFEALNHLGARRALLIEALSPPLSALLALIFLQEQLSVNNWLGIALTIVGVSWVVSERIPNNGAQPSFSPSSTSTLRGVSYGLLAVLGQAGGAVISRAVLAESTISPLWSSLLRLTAGVLVLVLWVLARRTISWGFKPSQFSQLLFIIGITAFFSTYLGIWLQQISLKYAPAGIAQALSNTSPLFVLPLAAWMGDTVSVRSIVGVILALGGIWLLFS